METEGHTTAGDDPLYVKQNKAHALLEQGRFEEAISLFEAIGRENANYPGVADGVKAARFWVSRQGKRHKFASPYDKGRLFLREWIEFEKYMQRNSVRHGRSTVAIQKYAFSDIIESFAQAYNEGLAPDTNLLVQIGDLFKRLGNYEKAAEVYEYARGFSACDPAILAKLGDCYFSMDETSKAKVLFREAFFIDAGQIELDQIESPLIKSLYAKTNEMIKNPETSMEWVPVIAELTRVFNVKREPKKGELEELRNAIKQLEAEYAGNRKKKAYIEPKRLNHYFWLIDTLKILGGSRKEIEQSLQRINEINPDVFARYLE